MTGQTVSPTLFLMFFIVIVFSIGASAQIDYGEINIMDTHRLSLRHEEDRGTLVFNGPTSGSPNPTTIRIQAKPNCYITVSPESTFNNNVCSYGYQMTSCATGCFYMYLFDAYYYNHTMRYIWDSDWRDFNTSSHVLYVGVCHMSETKDTIRLRFQSVERKFQFNGDSVHAPTGKVASTYFPSFYEQNGEQSTYIFQSRFTSDKVLIEFDDFDIAPGGYLYFHPTKDQLSPVKVKDDTPRFVVTSTTNQLQFIFDHGWPGESYRRHFGFKLTYRFLSEYETYITPITDCGRYYLTLTGGHIKFQPNRYDKPYDCVWVVKTQPGYAGSYMKLNRFSAVFAQDISPGDVNVEIHQGLTSNGSMVGKLIPSSALSNRDYEHKDGFYIRLRGTFRVSVIFELAFTSFTNFYASGCDTRDHFKCSTGKCIPKILACDSLKHCNDGSDETLGCADYSDSRSNQETITVSVVIPVVISVFLLIVLCIMFVLIRRCRQARQNMMESPMVVSTDRRGRRRQHDFFQRPADAPPTYDEALITGIPVPDDGYHGQPKPPSYSESTAFIPEDDYPSPPYSSREHINESFLEEPDDQVSSRNHLPSIATREPEPSAEPKLAALSSGRLPKLPSLAANVGTQSMCNISNVGHTNRLMKARSEQILLPKELGVINPAFTNDEGRHSRLYKGHAVSTLELPTNSVGIDDTCQGHSSQEYARSNLDLPSGRSDHSETSPQGHELMKSQHAKELPDSDQRRNQAKTNSTGTSDHATESPRNIQAQRNTHSAPMSPNHTQQKSAWERLKPKVPVGTKNRSSNVKSDNLTVSYTSGSKNKQEIGKPRVNVLDDNSSYRDYNHPSKQTGRDLKSSANDRTDHSKVYSADHDGAIPSSDAKLLKHRLSASIPNLCAGHRSDVHRSTVSLNEAAMSSNYQGPDSPDSDTIHVSLANIGEDIYV